jgi:3-isopropylmalate/(R)-2-methylmalate dehydratase small subunit
MEPIRVIAGAVSVLDRPDVDTDQIVPKQFLKRLERRGFDEFLFYDWAREPGWNLPSNPILATGRNFGCGSSREQAPWALQDYGFRAIVASSFADIFYANCSKIGLLTVPLSEDAVRKVMECGVAKVDLEAQEVTCPGLAVRFEIDPATRERLLNGLDEVSLTLQKLSAIQAYESSRRFALPDTSRI